jgi:hypothetical protein
MRNPTTWHVALSTCIAAGALPACGDDASPPPFQPPAMMTTTTGSGGQGGDGGGSAGAGGEGGAGAAGGGTPGVIADTPCARPGTGGVQLFAAGTAPVLDQIERVGSRLMASGPDGRVLFDANGTGLDATPMELAPEWNRVATEGNLGGMVASDGSIEYLRFDEDGAPLIGPLEVAKVAPTGLALTWGAGVALVVFGHNSRVRARAVEEDGGLATPVSFVVAKDAFASSLSLRAAARDVYAGIAFTGDGAAGANTTLFARADAFGLVAEPAAILTTAATHHVSAVVGTDDGYVVLFNGEGAADRPLLLALDESGVPTSEAYELEGAEAAYGLASLGGEVAVLVARASGEAEMRAFDTSLAPLGPWVCFGADHDRARPAAIARFESSYAVLVTTALGAVILYRVDHLGTSAP